MNITEMNYNKNGLQFILEKRILSQHSNSITVLIQNKNASHQDRF